MAVTTPIGAHRPVTSGRHELPAAFDACPRLDYHPTARIVGRHLLGLPLPPPTPSSRRRRAVSTELARTAARIRLERLSAFLTCSRGLPEPGKRGADVLPPLSRGSSTMNCRLPGVAGYAFHHRISVTTCVVIARPVTTFHRVQLLALIRATLASGFLRVRDPRAPTWSPRRGQGLRGLSVNVPTRLSASPLSE